MATTALHYRFRFRENRLGGNYCGHCKLCFDLDLAKPPKKGKGGIPPVLLVAIDILKDVVGLPSALVAVLDRANGSLRRMRSERREACLRLLMAILKHLDILSKRVGLPTDTGFLHHSMKFLAREARLGFKRSQRAMSDLVRTGLVVVTRRGERDADGSYQGLAAIKVASDRLFQLLGLTEMLARQRKKAREIAQQAKQVARSVTNAVSKLAKAVKKPTPAPRS